MRGGCIQKGWCCDAAAQAYSQEHGLDVPIEVETRSLEEVRQAKALCLERPRVRIDRVMLDNMARRDASKPGARSSPVPFVPGSKALSPSKLLRWSSWRMIRTPYARECPVHQA
jgi:hypothetical protein